MVGPPSPHYRARATNRCNFAGQCRYSDRTTRRPGLRLSAPIRHARSTSRPSPRHRRTAGGCARGLSTRVASPGPRSQLPRPRPASQIAACSWPSTAPSSPPTHPLPLPREGCQTQPATSMGHCAHAHAHARGAGREARLNRGRAGPRPPRGRGCEPRPQQQRRSAWCSARGRRYAAVRTPRPSRCRRARRWCLSLVR